MTVTNQTTTNYPTTTYPTRPGGPASLRHALPAVVVHRAFRREFHLAGPLVRRVPDGDTDRARVVGQHLEFLIRGLHHHHELEDELIWPVLHERLPIGDRQTIVTMERQHGEIDRIVRGIAQVLATWPTSSEAVAAFRGPLTEQLDALHDLLIVHLDMEERIAFPLAEKHLTAAEWRDISRHAEAEIPRHARTLSFGMLQYDGDPDVVATMLASAPRLVRILVPRLARRAYRRHAVAIHGTPNP